MEVSGHMCSYAVLHSFVKHAKKCLACRLGSEFRSGYVYNVTVIEHHYIPQLFFCIVLCVLRSAFYEHHLDCFQEELEVAREKLVESKHQWKSPLFQVSTYSAPSWHPCCVHPRKIAHAWLNPRSCATFTASNLGIGWGGVGSVGPPSRSTPDGPRASRKNECATLNGRKPMAHTCRPQGPESTGGLRGQVEHLKPIRFYSHWIRRSYGRY